MIKLVIDRFWVWVGCFVAVLFCRRRADFESQAMIAGQDAAVNETEGLGLDLEFRIYL
jgi:hypothetical protein